MRGQAPPDKADDERRQVNRARLTACGASVTRSHLAPAPRTTSFRRVPQSYEAEERYNPKSQGSRTLSQTMH